VPDSAHIIDLAEYADGGVIRESTLRGKLAALDLESLRGREVHINGCGPMPIPTWAFMMVAACVSQTATRVTFGEASQPLQIFERTAQVR
jgi:hypothetical protein